MNQREPEFDSAFDGAIAAATDDFVRITLKAQAAKDYFLLIGPPGTGKTSRALRGMVEAFYREGKEILFAFIYQPGGGRDMQDADGHYSGS